MPGPFTFISCVQGVVWNHCALTVMFSSFRDIMSIYKEPPPGMFVVPDPHDMTKVKDSPCLLGFSTATPVQTGKTGAWNVSWYSTLFGHDLFSKGLL